MDQFRSTLVQVSTNLNTLQRGLHEIWTLIHHQPQRDDDGSIVKIEFRREVELRGRQKIVRGRRSQTKCTDDFDSLRPLCYPKTNVFMLCFSVMCPTSYHNVVDKWYPEIRRHLPDTPIILVGTQCDLRNDVKVLIELAHYSERPVTEVQAKRLAEEIGAVSYIECSSLTQKNLKEVFDTAILSALDMCKKPKVIKRNRSFRWSRKGKNTSEKRHPQPVLPLRPLSDCSVKRWSGNASVVSSNRVFSVNCESFVIFGVRGDNYHVRIVSYRSIWWLALLVACRTRMCRYLQTGQRKSALNDIHHYRTDVPWCNMLSYIAYPCLNIDGTSFHRSCHKINKSVM